MRLHSHAIPRTAGFTLVELLIATSIAGVLASVAYPTFAGALRKVRRSDALFAMLQLQTARERSRSGNVRYGTLAEVGIASMAPGGNYLLSVTEPSPTGYVAFAQATGAQQRDHECRHLSIAVESGDPTYRSGETGAAANDEPASRNCWNL